jgi:hypothetical protein
MRNPTPEDERFTRRVATLVERCHETTECQLVAAATDDIADLEYAATILHHIGWRGPRG